MFSISVRKHGTSGFFAHHGCISLDKALHDADALLAEHDVMIQEIEQQRRPGYRRTEAVVVNQWMVTPD